MVCFALTCEDASNKFDACYQGGARDFWSVKLNALFQLKYLTQAFSCTNENDGWMQPGCHEELHSAYISHPDLFLQEDKSWFF